MSWSVNLQGPKEVLVREISDLLLVADRALDWAQGAEDKNTLNVNLNGYVSWNDEGITSSTVGFGVTESASVKLSE
jgi:hypothetical protein